MASAGDSIKWQDILEKEFDKAFVDLELLLRKYLSSNSGAFEACQNLLTCLNSTFTQLNQRALTIFYSNAKLEAQLVSARADLTQALSDSSTPEKSTADAASDPKVDDARAAAVERDLLLKENAELTRYCQSLQSEVYGARLAAKYLDKELAGRIQQIQLLGRKLEQGQHGRLWAELEAEIQLHRHKTVIRACRGRPVHHLVRHPSRDPSSLRRPHQHGVGDLRRVLLRKSPAEGLGMSIAGGREHGVPVLVSDLQPGLPASRSQKIFIGDAILSVNGVSLRSALHSEAARVLSNQPGNEVSLEVVFVTPDDGSDVEEESDTFTDIWSGNKFRLYDSRLVDSADSRQNSTTSTTKESKTTTKESAKAATAGEGSVGADDLKSVDNSGACDSDDRYDSVSEGLDSLHEAKVPASS